MIIIIYYNYQY